MMRNLTGERAPAQRNLRSLRPLSLLSYFPKTKKRKKSMVRDWTKKAMSTWKNSQYCSQMLRILLERFAMLELLHSMTGTMR